MDGNVTIRSRVKRKSDSATKPKSNIKIEELNVVESLAMITMSENMPAMDIHVFTQILTLRLLLHKRPVWTRTG